MFLQTWWFTNGRSRPCPICTPCRCTKHCACENCYLIYRHKCLRGKTQGAQAESVQGAATRDFILVLRDISHAARSSSTVDDWCSSSRRGRGGGRKEYPITPRQVSPSPVNLYINFALSLRFMALKEFVPAPQTHVSLCRTLGGGGTWRKKKKTGVLLNGFTSVQLAVFA